MPRRKHKIYKRPRKLYDKIRIEEENVLVKRYGLKSKREVWKAESAIGVIRKRAKLLLTKPAEEQNRFVEKLKKQGFPVEKIAEVLSLDKEAYLKRRLQSIVVERKIASTPKQARQFIVHKHIKINNKKVNIPSYLVPVDEEDKIELSVVKKEKKTEKLMPAQAGEAENE
jgi:small subunit ribosomal protein S4